MLRARTPQWIVAKSEFEDLRSHEARIRRCCLAAFVLFASIRFAGAQTVTYTLPPDPSTNLYESGFVEMELTFPDRFSTPGLFCGYHGVAIGMRLSVTVPDPSSSFPTEGTFELTTPDVTATWDSIHSFGNCDIKQTYTVAGRTLKGALQGSSGVLKGRVIDGPVEADVDLFYCDPSIVPDPFNPFLGLSSCPGAHPARDRIFLFGEISLNSFPGATIPFYHGVSSFLGDAAKIAPNNTTDFKVDGIFPVQVSTPDITVGDMHPDANGDHVLDLVSGKPALIIAKIGVSGARALPADTPITIDLLVDDQHIDTIHLSYSDLAAAAFKTEFHYTPRAPAGPPGGVSRITVRVDPNNTIPESDKSNNDKSVDVQIKVTRPLRILYFKYDCFTDVDDALFSYTVTSGRELTNAIFPADPNQMAHVISSVSVPCGSSRAQDYDRLFVAGKRAAGYSNNRVVAITTRDWFLRRADPSVFGITNGCWGKVSLVEQGEWTAITHELLHTLGLTHTSNPKCTLTDNPGPTDGDRALSATKFAHVSNLPSLMDPFGPRAPLSPDDTNVWIGLNHYEYAFGRSLVFSADPEVLLIHGNIDRNGSVTLGPMYRGAAGVVDESTPGDFTIEVLDAKDIALHSTRLHIGFQSESGIPISEDFATFGAAVPFLTNAAAIRLQNNGVTLFQAELRPTLLRDAITGLPDGAFSEDSVRQRRDLLKKVDQFAESKEDGDDVVERLIQLRKRIVREVVDDVARGSILQTTKAEVLDLIDSLITKAPQP